MKTARKLCLSLALLVFPFAAAPVTAQVPGVVHAISTDEGAYSGDGIAWIIEQADAAQFVLFGEQHGIAGIPEIVASAYEALNSEGFAHLVLEMDRWTVAGIESQGLNEIVRSSPHAIAFGNDGDLQLISNALEMGESKQAGRIWGLDQMITAIHPFQRLAEIAPNANARRLARGAFQKATLRMGEYLREAHFTDLDNIEAAFGQAMSEEAALILADLRSSMDIYTRWRAGQRGEISTSISPTMRESMMKDRLNAYLAEHGNDARAVFKMGGAHTMNGIGPNGVETLGEYARLQAGNNGRETLSIGIRAYNQDAAFPPPGFFDEADIILIDVPAYLQAANLDSSLPPLGQYDDQFDALIYLQNPQRAASTRVSQSERNFRNGFITSLVLPAVLTLILISSVVPLLVTLFRKPDNGPVLPLVFSTLLAMVLALLFALQLYAILSYPGLSATIMPANQSLWLFVLALLLALLLMGLQYRAWQNRWWSKAQRVYQSLLATAIIAFVAVLYYWNSGGMLA